MYSRQQGKYGYVPNYAKTFSHRPELMKLWADLLYGIRRNMDLRHFELATVAAAMAVGSTYCSLAHGQALLKFFSQEEALAIVSGDGDSCLSAAERKLMNFASRIAREASSVRQQDVDELRAAGFSDTQVFDIAAAATARTFFAQLCEGLGTLGDHGYPDLEPALRDALVVGRPIETTAPERLEDDEASRAVA
jgi:uncharacterized peroxidase-related enzyme